jgi:hypothetical protein
MTDIVACSGCSATWTGLAACHATCCHRTFTGIYAFDQHRLGGECHNPADRGLVQVEKPQWSGWGCPGDDTRWDRDSYGGLRARSDE